MTGFNLSVCIFLFVSLCVLTDSCFSSVPGSSNLPATLQEVHSKGAFTPSESDVI